MSVLSTPLWRQLVPLLLRLLGPRWLHQTRFLALLLTGSCHSAFSCLVGQLLPIHLLSGFQNKAISSFVPMVLIDVCFFILCHLSGASRGNGDSVMFCFVLFYLPCLARSPYGLFFGRALSNCETNYILCVLYGNQFLLVFTKHQ